MTGQLPEEVFPDPAPCPANKPIVDRRWRTILGRAIAPAATGFQHVHDPADDAPIVRPFDTAHICWQMRLDPPPLFIAQPEEALTHDPDPQCESGVHGIMDCLATAAKLMSFGPSTTVVP